MKKILLTFLSLVLFTACNQAEVEKEEVQLEEKITVVTTVAMIEDMVSNIAGDLVNLESLMGAGVDPHLYKPSAGDINKLENADVIFYIGHHLEGKMLDVFESLSENKIVYAIAESLDSTMLLDPQDGDTGDHDPHIWFDVNLWSQTVPVVRDALIAADPNNEEIYQLNAQNYIETLLELDNWVVDQIALISDDQKIMVTAHDAFNYFGNAYGMRVEGLQGISTASEYGLNDLELLINLIVENKLKAIFIESSVPVKSIEALQEGVKAEDWNVAIGGELFSDAMGDPNTLEGTYIGMVEHNVNTIVNALK